MTKDDLEKNLDRVHEWIKAADQKVSIFLAFQGVVIVILMPYIQDLFSKYQSVCSVYRMPLVLGSVVLMSYGLLKSAMALIPRLKNHIKKSLIYFGDISAMKIEDFKKDLENMSEADYKQQLIEQIHVSSRIAAVKHKQFKDSVLLFILGLGLFILIYLVLNHG